MEVWRRFIPLTSPLNSDILGVGMKRLPQYKSWGAFYQIKTEGGKNGERF